MLVSVSRCVMFVACWLLLLDAVCCIFVVSCRWRLPLLVDRVLVGVFVVCGLASLLSFGICRLILLVAMCVVVGFVLLCALCMVCCCLMSLFVVRCLLLVVCCCLLFWC